MRALHNNSTISLACQQTIQSQCLLSCQDLTLLASIVQWFQVEDEALRAFCGLRLLLLSFFSFLWNRWGETCTSSPFSSRLQWQLTFSDWIALCFCSTCISFPQKISQPVQFQVKHKALHAQKAHPTCSLARSHFPCPPSSFALSA